MPDCGTTACPSTCKCVEDHCASQINDCLSDPTCATGQGCIDACKCGDKACAAGCAANTPSPKGLAILTCAETNGCPLAGKLLPEYV